MRRMFWSSLAIALLMSPATYGQSLGDTARENRDKKEAEEAAGTAPKVITNKDLPKDPDANPDSPAGSEAAVLRPTVSQSADRFVEQRAAEQRLAEQRAADQWKRQILAQKNRMVNLQARIEQLQASIESAGSVQYESPVNRYQARQMQRVAQLQRQFDEQKRKLDQMQEAARHAGMHSAVYDP